MASHTVNAYRSSYALALSKQHSFDYEGIRSRFMVSIERYQNKLVNKKNIPYTRENIEKTITVMQEENVNRGPSNGGNMQLAECKGEKFLVYHQDDGDRRIISKEEAFDLFVEEHLKYNHRNARDIWDSLSGYYYFPKPWLDNFVLFCKCSVFNEMIHIDILSTEFADHFDGNFKYVLLYADKGTDFVIIRPLTSTTESELTVEILKIFADFNVPRSVELYPHHKVLFEKVFANVENVLGKLNISIFSTRKSQVSADTQVTQIVKSELQQWISTNKSNNWAIGCHIVQHKLNNTIFKNESPYVCVFKGDSALKARIWLPPSENIPQSNSDNSAKTEEKHENIAKVTQETTEEEKIYLYFDDEDTKSNIEIFDIEEHDTQKTSGICTGTKVLKGCCCECNKIVTTSANYCNKCKRIVHLLCSRRVVKIVDSTADLKIFCTLCFDIKQMEKNDNDT